MVHALESALQGIELAQCMIRFRNPESKAIPSMKALLEGLIKTFWHNDGFVGRPARNILDHQFFSPMYLCLLQGSLAFRSGRMSETGI